MVRAQVPALGSAPPSSAVPRTSASSQLMLHAGTPACGRREAAAEARWVPAAAKLDSRYLNAPSVLGRIRKPLSPAGRRSVHPLAWAGGCRQTGCIIWDSLYPGLSTPPTPTRACQRPLLGAVPRRRGLARLPHRRFWPFTVPATNKVFRKTVSRGLLPDFITWSSSSS